MRFVAGASKVKRVNMSYIFDALQRSEYQSSKGSVSATLDATELLQRAERRAAEKWEAASQHDHPDSTRSEEHLTSFGQQAIQYDAAAVESRTEENEVLVGQRTNLFEQFQVLQVTPVAQNRMVCLTDDENSAVDGFRLLGLRLRHLRRNRVLKKVLITSTVPQEGKSIIAANLACALSLRTQHKIVLVEGDLRRPTVSRMFGIGTNPGLYEYLQGERPLAKSIYHIKEPSLWIMPAGIAPRNAKEPLQSAKLSVLMDKLTTCFEWIIIDSPPVLPLADTTVWMRHADGILLVTREGTTRKKQLRKGLEAIEPSKLIGALLNCSKNSVDSSYYYGTSSATSRDDQSAD
jgi:capsular exopolysaccharide synthesis family protein